MDWSEEQAIHDRQAPNIGSMQRLASALIGGGLLATGLGRRSLSGAGLSILGATLLYRGLSGYCMAVAAMGIETEPNGSSTNALGRRKVHTDRAVKIRRTIEIDRPPDQLYRFWRSFDNLPRVMSHLESVHVVNERLSHWVVRTIPGAPPVEWDAEIINDVENERIGWRSLNGADVDNTGSVEFEPAGAGRTNLTVTLQYAPPAGRIGAAVAKWLGEDPDSKIAQDLLRFKDSLESGVYSGRRDR